MSKSDYYRPAPYQITKHYECSNCGREYEMESIYQPGNCHCGGSFLEVGESYPASCDDWDEERYTQDGEWHRRRY